MSSGEMRTLGSSGDVRIQWDSDNAEEVTAARTQFDTLIGKGYRAFSVKRNGEAGEQINKFDPEAEKIILMKQLRGG